MDGDVLHMFAELPRTEQSCGLRLQCSKMKGLSTRPPPPRRSLPPPRLPWCSEGLFTPDGPLESSSAARDPRPRWLYRPRARGPRAGAVEGTLPPIPRAGLGGSGRPAAGGPGTWHRVGIYWCVWKSPVLLPPRPPAASAEPCAPVDRRSPQPSSSSSVLQITGNGDQLPQTSVGVCAIR